MTKVITWIATLFCALSAINMGVLAFGGVDLVLNLSVALGVPGIQAFIYGFITASGIWVLLSTFMPCCKK